MTLYDAVVLIPSLHPDHLLPDYVHKLISHGFQRIVVVDDGSGNDYAPIFDGLRALPGVTVLGYATNRGKGYALRHGMQDILNRYPDAPGIVTADSDGQHTAPDVKKLAEALMADGSLLHLGSRDLLSANVPPKSRFGNRLTSFMFRLLYGHWLPDTQTGLRAFSLDLVPFMLDTPGDRFEYEMNMLTRWAVDKKAFNIVPIETIYLQENKGTHFRPIKDGLRIYRHLFGNFFRYMGSALASTALDIGLFYLLDSHLLPRLLPAGPGAELLGQVTLASVLARIGSSLFNFKVNKDLVFNKTGSRGALGRYALLAIACVGLSALFVWLLSSVIPIDRVIIKAVVDTALFFINYRVQRAWVFHAPNAQEDL